MSGVIHSSQIDYVDNFYYFVDKCEICCGFISNLLEYTKALYFLKSYGKCHVNESFSILIGISMLFNQF